MASFSTNSHLHTLEEIKSNYNYLLADFDKLYLFIEDTANPTAFTAYGIAICTRIALIRKYYPKKGELLIRLYQELYQRWQLINTTQNLSL